MEERQAPVPDLRPWGYAPGGYRCVCHAGENPHFFDGDKRAVRCEEHATQLRDAMPKPTPLPALMTITVTDVLSQLTDMQKALTHAGWEIAKLRAALGLNPRYIEKPNA